RPKEKFSPSQLDRAQDCMLKWAYRYLLGFKSRRSSKSAMLGTLIHACLQAHMKRRPVYDFWPELEPSNIKELALFTPEEQEKMKSEAPKRAIAGLHLLPNLDDPLLEIVELEQRLQVDCSAVLSHIHGVSLSADPLIIEGKVDLAYRRAGIWYLVDHKSTGGRRNAYQGLKADPWAYVKTEEELRTDMQSVLYALGIMQKHGLQELWIRWVYYLTDTAKHPNAKPVDVLLTRAEVEKRAAEIIKLAFDLRSHIRVAQTHKVRLEMWKDPVLPPEPNSPCEAYGGCEYSAVKGG